MYVCICNAITDKQIINAKNQGHTTIKSINRHLGVGNCCGRCIPAAKEVLANHSVQKYIRQPLLTPILSTF